MAAQEPSPPSSLEGNKPGFPQENTGQQAGGQASVQYLSENP